MDLYVAKPKGYIFSDIGESSFSRNVFLLVIFL